MIGWVDASAGASGDMLLGALISAGVPLEVLQSAVDTVTPEPVTLHAESVTRNGLAAMQVHVAAGPAQPRTWRDISPLVSGTAHRVFSRLAEAEAYVHGTTTDHVHFHEVGALDAIADIVAACAGFGYLGLDALTVSVIGVGSGTVTTQHGALPVPPPAVAELLRGVPSYAGPAQTESCTPTGAALLTTLATAYGPQPPMRVQQIGIGAGGRDPGTHANVVRLLIGETVEISATEPGEPRVLEANIDDLDPRLWPDVIAALLAVGASDAWLTPILMKKGRPAHTLHALVTPETAARVEHEIFRQTSTIGVRSHTVRKSALEREFVTVVVDGHDVRVKLAGQDGIRLNAQPEYSDVAQVAQQTGRPIKDVLAEAAALARALE